LKKTGKKSKKQNNTYRFWFNKKIIILLFIFIALVIYFLFLKKPTEPQFVKEGEVTFLKNGTKQVVKRIDVEVANNPTERSQGMMYRSQMDDDKGMLFIFDHSDSQSFWMKNTILPLDIMFIDSEGVIDTIYRKTTPYSERSLPSRRKVQFVVEVNGGWSDKNGVKESDLIEFKVDR